MGDRSNVFIQQARDTNGEWQGVGYYSHWGGTEMQAQAITAARESLARLGDPSYFTRRVMHKLMNATISPDDETGAGLWTLRPDDNEYPVLVINADTGLAWLTARKPEPGEFRRDAPEEAQHVSVFGWMSASS